MTGLVVMVLVLVVLAVLAPRFGVDTRDGRDWSSDGGRSVGRAPAARRTVGSDARALADLFRGLGRRLAGAWDACRRAHQSRGGDDPPPRRIRDPDAYRCSEQRAPRRGDDVPPGRDEPHWRAEGGGWRLRGRMLPLAPPEGEPSARRD
jgi:hypothetical protein